MYPAFVLVNGLTQHAELWFAYRDALVARQFRVATFDLLGQGASDKPALFISHDDQVTALDRLIDELDEDPVFLDGISFGGLIALRYAIAHGKRLAGLAPMSCFAELSPQLFLLGSALRTGLILGGTSYLQNLLLVKPDLTADLLAHFAQDVLANNWRGEQTVWIAPDGAGGTLTLFPDGYDHLRAIPVPGRS